MRVNVGGGVEIVHYGALSRVLRIWGQGEPGGRVEWNRRGTGGQNGCIGLSRASGFSSENHHYNNNNLPCGNQSRKCRGCYGSGARVRPKGGLNGTGGVRGDKTGVSDYPGHRDSVLKIIITIIIISPEEIGSVSYFLASRVRTDWRR